MISEYFVKSVKIFSICNLDWITVQKIDSINYKTNNDEIKETQFLMFSYIFIGFPYIISQPCTKRI